MVVHDEGLVTGWAQTDCVDDVVGLGDPRGSFAVPDDATWVVLAGDLTALPAMARIAEQVELPVTTYAEVPDGPMPDYLPGEVSWSVAAPGEQRPGRRRTPHRVAGGPATSGWRGSRRRCATIRRHVRHDLGWDTKHHEVMGYWSGSRGRQARQVDPGPIYARGQAQGKSDEQIWADYDQARGTR